MVYDGGVVENVILSNLVVNTIRYDWFWWGNGDPIYFVIKRRSENEGKTPKPEEPPAGKIRNVTIRNVIAHGQGTSIINGHPDSWLERVSLENVKLFLATDPSAAYDRSVNAMQFRWARNLTVKDVEVVWAGRAVGLQGAEIIGVAQVGTKALEDAPVELRRFFADVLIEVTHQIGDHLVVIEQRVVHIEQVDDWRAHLLNNTVFLSGRAVPDAWNHTQRRNLWTVETVV